LQLAILDDYQHLALQSADWDRLRRRGIEVSVFHDAFASEEDAAARLAPFEILCLMRERTAFPRSLVERLPKLRLVTLTGVRAPSLDADACAERGVPVSHTRGGDTGASTSELAWGLIVAAARDLAKAERGMRAGRWHQGLAGGMVLEGRRLGLLGLGKLGARMARVGAAFGMQVAAWSPNLTRERAAAAGATLLGKNELFETSDVLSIHLVLGARTRGLVGAAELARMKPGSILVNTSRGPIVDESALLAGLRNGRPGHAALDVYDREPLPADHPLRGMDNVTLSPHLGYVSMDVMRAFYADTVENVEAWLDGKPLRVLNPGALA
jgi:phosphoglycerate dehydrogenase-like enzyme